MNPSLPRSARWRRLQALVPTPWLLLAWIGWWGWRYAAVQGLAGYDQARGAMLVPLGLVQDAMLLYAVFTWLRWQAAERATGGRPPVSRWLIEVVSLGLLSSAVLRALDAVHCHLLGSHLTARFWLALGAHLADWTGGLHTLLLLAAATALVARWALGRHLRQGEAMARHLGGPHPQQWLRRQWSAALIAAVVGLVATGIGGVTVDGTAVLPEARAVLTLARALGIAG